MKVTGIIMECNPFHEGHAFLLREARRRTEADYIVAVMSGDFVQRGEPAVFDKYIRAESILRAGADLVLELPMYAACGSAEYFARGGISLLASLGVVTDLCFGSESTDLEMLLRSAEILEMAEKGTGPAAPSPGSYQQCGEISVSAGQYREKLLAGMKEGLSYPAARDAALPGGFPSSPNDLLAAEYCRALRKQSSSIRPHAVERIDVPSATQCRKELLRARLQNAEDFLTEGNSSGETALPRTSVTQVPLFPLGTDDFSPALLYALRMQRDDLERFADVSGDLADRIRNLLPRFRSFDSFCSLLKTRNLTRSRISRCLLHILLQMEQTRLDTLHASGAALWARPLAMRKNAAPLLSAIHKNATVPFLSKLSSAPALLSGEALSFLEEEFRAEELYTMTLFAAASAAASGNESPFTGEKPAEKTGLNASPLAMQRRTVIL